MFWAWSDETPRESRNSDCNYLMFYTYFRPSVAHYSYASILWPRCGIHTGFYAQRMIYSKSSALEKSIHCSSSALAASHRGCEWLRAGCRAAAGGGSSHGPERFRWMAASSCRSVLGSGKVDITGSRKQIRQHAQTLMSFTADVVVVFRCMWRSCWCLMEPVSMPRPS